MPIDERFTQAQAVAVKVGGFVTRRQPVPTVLTVDAPASGLLLLEQSAETILLSPSSFTRQGRERPGTGALRLGRSPPWCGVRTPTS